MFAWYILTIIFFLYVIVRFLLKFFVFNYWKKRNVPYVEPNFIFGNLWDVISLQKTWSTFIDDLHGKYTSERYIGIFNIFQPALIVRDIELIKDILIKDFDHFQNNWFEVDPNIDPLLALGPFVRKDKDWKDSRILLTPQFTTAKLRSMFPCLQHACTDMIQYIYRQSEKSTCFEAKDLFSRFTGDVVMSCAFGLEAKSFFKAVPETFLIDGTSPGIPSKLITFKRTLGLLFGFFSKLFRVTFYGDPIPHLFSDIISTAVQDRVNNQIVRNDYLNYIMELKDKHKIAECDMAGYAYIFFLDGYETSYSMLSYALLELSLNQDVQETARKEVDLILEKYNGCISYEAHQELKYMEQVVFETLRKNPAVKVMSKVCTSTYTMHDNERNLIIEKGTPVFFSLRAIHYNPEYYPDPDKFDPTRFSEEIKQTRPKYSFQGFGDGPRICIGRRFAISEMVVALASILAKFELHFNNKTALPIRHDSFHVTDVPVSGLYIDIVPRTTKSSK